MPRVASDWRYARWDGLRVIVEAFGADTDQEIVRILHSELSEQGVAPGLTIEQLQVVFREQGWLVFQDGRCVAGAAIVLAESAVEADLVWLALSSASNEVRESLLQAVLMQAREMRARRLLCYLPESDTENLSFMASEACEAEVVAGYSRWVNHLGNVVEMQAPEGTSVRVSDDEDALLLAARVVWDDLPGHKPATREAAREAIEAFGAGNQFLLLDGSGSPIGLVRGLMISENEAYIDAPGLAPEWRKPESYAFLLAHMMSHLARLGAQMAVMESWGDPPTAMKGFRSAGWVQKLFMPAMRIPVAPAAD